MATKAVLSLQPCVPYAWQFAGEHVGMPSTQGGGLNCFALLSRDNCCFAEVTQQSITADWISERLDRLSLSVCRLSVVVLDNARVHTKAVKERFAVWQERGLFVWFLPTYSPHLNIANVPLSLAGSSGDAFVGEIFDLAISALAAPGDYTSSFTI